MLKRTRTLTLIALVMSCGLAYAGKPLKVYILVGQSNMQGKANINTAPHMAADPGAKALYDKLFDATGNPRVHDDIRVVAFSQSKGNKDVEKNGPLTAGFGSELTSDAVCGPELAFGIAMREIVKQPILLIKTSWGGKNISNDFRPPSAGPFTFTTKPQKGYDKERKEAIAAKTSHYYDLMVKHVNSVLADPGKYHPAYDKAAGYEVAGFVWFQGWNDAVDSHSYPDRNKPGGYDKYSEVLADFIRDVRKAFKAPNMPFVIGVMGIDGPSTEATEAARAPRYRGITPNFRKAMAAPASMPEFEGNVKAVWTDQFWPNDIAAAGAKVNQLKKAAGERVEKEIAGNPELKKSAGRLKQEYTKELIEKQLTERERLALSGQSSQGFHYYGSLKCVSQIGEAFAKAIAACK